MGWASRTGAAAALRRARFDREMMALADRIESVEAFDAMLARAHPGLAPHLRAALIPYLSAHVRMQLAGIPAVLPSR